MTDSFIQLPPDSTGKLVDTSSLTVGANTVQRERDVIADPTNAAGLAAVENTTPGSSDYGLVVRPVNGALETGGNLATLAGTVTGGVQQNNEAQWGGVAVTAPAASTPPSGTDVGPTVRPIQRKQTQLLNPATISASATYNSAWFDSQANGDAFVTLTFSIPSSGYGSNALKIQVSDDQTNIVTAVQTTPTAATLGQVFTPINSRYWRVQFVNGATLQTAPLLTVTTENVSPVAALLGSAGLIAAQNPSGYIVTTSSNGNSLSDGTTASYSIAASSGTANVLGVLGMSTTSGSAGTTIMNRCPASYKSVQATASGSTAIISAVSAQKIRILGYRLQVTANASQSSGGVITFDILDAAATIGLTHDVFIPTTAITTTPGDAYDSGWVNLQPLGIITAAVNTALNLNLSAALATGNARVIVAYTQAATP